MICYQNIFMFSAIIIGILGFLSGMWLASIGNSASVSGILGGMITFIIGYYGLHKNNLYGNIRK